MKDPVNLSPGDTASVKQAASAAFAALAALEQCLQSLSEALIRGDAVSFSSQTTAVPRLIEGLSSACQALPSALLTHPQFQKRLRAVSSGIALQRENMARRAAGVDRELRVFFPGRESATYGRASAGYGQRAGTGTFASLHA